MTYDFSQFKKKIGEAKEWLVREFAMIRTGRATATILDGIKVDSYGTKVAINHVAGVTTEDPKTLRVTPWDKTQIKEIEVAVNNADIGVSVAVDDQGLRVIFPELTGERREALLKLAKNKLEEARVSLRSARDDTWSDIQEKERESVLSEDDKFRAKEEMEKMNEEANKAMQEMSDKKEKEISQ
jgi:ribosome recycling factor